MSKHLDLAIQYLRDHRQDFFNNLKEYVAFPSVSAEPGHYPDVHHAAEWVADWHEDRYYVGSPATDPTGPSSGRFREVRGGSWSYYPRSLRLSARLPKSPGDSQSNIGFRCAVDGR